MIVVCDLVLFALYYLFFTAACWRLYTSFGGFSAKNSVRLAIAWPATLPLLTIVALADLVHECKNHPNV